MLLEGSCHCGAVKFSVESSTPYPFNWCYCSICRKTAGGGGYAINIMADAETLDLQGGENITVYRSASNERGRYEEDGLSRSRRHFCMHCGSALWVANPAWPEMMHPFASAIDTPLPKPPEIRTMMTDYAPEWAALPEGPDVNHYESYADESIEDWHKRHGLYEEE